MVIKFRSVLRVVRQSHIPISTSQISRILDDGERWAIRRVMSALKRLHNLGLVVRTESTVRLKVQVGNVTTTTQNILWLAVPGAVYNRRKNKEGREAAYRRRYMLKRINDQIAVGKCKYMGCNQSPAFGTRLCEIHRISYNTQERERRKMSRQPPSLSLEEGQHLILNGVKFGDVYPKLNDDDRVIIRHWYCREAVGVPIIRTEPVKSKELVPVNGTTPLAKQKRSKLSTSTITTTTTTTGNPCPNCQGGNMVRTGSCVTCQDCGHNEGCG